MGFLIPEELNQQLDKLIPVGMKTTVIKQLLRMLIADVKQYGDGHVWTVINWKDE